MQSMPIITKAEFVKLHMGLVVLVKIMSVLINFLLQNTNPDRTDNFANSAKVVSLNPAHDEVYSIQHYVTFVSDLWQVGGFLRVLLFPAPIKLTVTI